MFKDAKFGDELVLRDGPRAFYCGMLSASSPQPHMVMVEGLAHVFVYSASGAYSPDEKENPLDVVRVKRLEVLYGTRGFAGSPGFGYEVEIRAATDDPSIFKGEALKDVIYDLGESVTREIKGAAIVAVPGTAERQEIQLHLPLLWAPQVHMDEQWRTIYGSPFEEKEEAESLLRAACDQIPTALGRVAGLRILPTASVSREELLMAVQSFLAKREALPTAADLDLLVAFANALVPAEEPWCIGPDGRGMKRERQE